MAKCENLIELGMGDSNKLVADLEFAMVQTLF